MLTDTQKAMIDAAAGTYKYAGSLDAVARERFDMSATRFWQDVNRMLLTEAAHAYRPEAVARLNSRRRPQQRLGSRILN